MTAQRIAIVGGCGFVGQNLAVEFAQNDFSVLILDFAEFPQHLFKYKAISFAKVDLLDPVKVEKAISEFKPILLIHLASWGMSGEPMLSPLCQTINVHGTQNLLDICFKHNISKFIYTSSYNVIFGGKEIAGGDESMPYFEEEEQVDQYSASKTRAEKLVLHANGKVTNNGTTKFYSASIRPAAIYGEGELRHLPRIIKHMDNGLFIMRIGTAMVDWVHIDNLMFDQFLSFGNKSYICALSVSEKGIRSLRLECHTTSQKIKVQAFTLLATKMLNTTDTSTVPAGQAYFISDGTPVSNFHFLKPLCEARKRVFPSTVVPTSLMLTVSHAMESVYFGLKWFSGGRIRLVPILTRAEVLKVGVTHYFSIDKARKELNYQPTVTTTEGAARIATYYSTPERLTNADYFEIAHPMWWIAVLSGMGLLGICAYTPQDILTSTNTNTLIQAVNSLALTIFRSQNTLQYVFTAAVATHCCEALWAVKVCERVKVSSTLSAVWFAQTMCLGYPSLRLLFKRENVMMSKGETGGRISKVE